VGFDGKELLEDEERLKKVREEVKKLER